MLLFPSAEIKIKTIYLLSLILSLATYIDGALHEQTGDINITNVACRYITRNSNRWIKLLQLKETKRIEKIKINQSNRIHEHEVKIPSSYLSAVFYPLDFLI